MTLLTPEQKIDEILGIPTDDVDETVKTAWEKAKQQLISLLEEEKINVLEPIAKAWYDKGSHPEYHDQQMRRLETEWGSLYFAISNRLQALKQPKDIK